MKAAAENFLRDLDKAYEPSDDWKDYCLECCVPGGPYHPVQRNGRWLPKEEFSPAAKISELLRKHKIDVEIFWSTWAEIAHVDEFDPWGDYIWQSDALIECCPLRSRIVEVLESL